MPVSLLTHLWLMMAALLLLLLLGVEPEPFELGEHLVEASGKLIVLDRLLEFLHHQKHKVLIFSQMTRVLDILQDYMGFRGTE